MGKGDRMITINSLEVDGLMFTGIHLELPGTELFIITNEVGYIISTSLVTKLTTHQMNGQQIIAGAVSNVSAVEDILRAPLEEITEKARHQGWVIGMCGRDALLKIA